MRVLHTGDIHLNGGFDTDAAESLNKIAEICTREEIDYIHINGDIFDSKSTPEQRLVFKNFLNMWPPSFIIRGNHDQPEDLKIYISQTTIVAEQPKWVSFGDNYNVLAIPHFNAGALAQEVDTQEELGEKGSNAFDDLINSLINQAYTMEGIKVLTFHGTVGGAMLDNGYIPRHNGIHLRSGVLETFPGLVIGGHYHKYQDVLGNGSIFYSGSPTRHTFGEEGEKGVIIVDYDKDNVAHHRFVEIKGRPMFVLGCEFKNGEVIWDDPEKAEAAKEGGDVKIKCRVDKDDIVAMKSSKFMDDYANADVLKFDPEIRINTTIRCEEIKGADSIPAAVKLWLEQTGYEDGEITRLLEQLETLLKVC